MSSSCDIPHPSLRRHVQMQGQQSERSTSRAPEGGGGLADVKFAIRASGAPPGFWRQSPWDGFFIPCRSLTAPGPVEVPREAEIDQQPPVVIFSRREGVRVRGSKIDPQASSGVRSDQNFGGNAAVATRRAAEAQKLTENR